MIAVAPDGGEVWALAVDPQEALLDYLEQFYNLRRAGAALKKMGAVDFATTIAPGLRDVLLTGKAVEVVRRKPEDKKNHYDAVVIDAPPTGRITKFLNVNSEMSGLAKVGPIRNHADLVMSVIASPRTAVHLVTLLEEMPVQETIDGIAELTAAGLPVGSVFVNMTRPSVLTDDQRAAALAGTLPLEQIGADLASAGIPAEPLATELAAEARDYALRIALEGRELQRIDELSLRHLTLPLLPGGVDLGGLYALAACLRAEGVR
jgi:anion-transporting  ArsA/GET3 family ATPase